MSNCVAKMQAALLLLLLVHVGTSLVCHECGVPGAMQCDEAVRANLLVAVRCGTGSCAETSYTFANGERIEARFCNRDRSYTCSSAQREDMNYDTCETCTTDFCNGPLPACDSQLHYVSTCVRQVNVGLVIWVGVPLLGLCLFSLCFFQIRQRKRLRFARTPLVPLAQGGNRMELLHTVQYTHI